MFTKDICDIRSILNSSKKEIIKRKSYNIYIKSFYVNVKRMWFIFSFQIGKIYIV